jgi:hypothetical protein
MVAIRTSVDNRSPVQPEIVAAAINAAARALDIKDIRTSTYPTSMPPV